MDKVHQNGWLPAPCDLTSKPPSNFYSEPDLGFGNTLITNRYILYPRTGLPQDTRTQSGSDLCGVSEILFFISSIVPSRIRPFYTHRQRECKSTALLLPGLYSRWTYIHDSFLQYPISYTGYKLNNQCLDHLARLLQHHLLVDLILNPSRPGGNIQRVVLAACAGKFYSKVRVSGTYKSFKHRVRCDLKDLQAASTGEPPRACSNCLQRGLNCM